VGQEQMAAQFLGDLAAYDRLDALVRQLAELDAHAPRTVLVSAQVASATHRFSEASALLMQAGARGALKPDASRLLLGIDQARGTRLNVVLEERRRLAERSGRLEDLVPLAATLVDLGDYDEADRIYQQALAGYHDASPFAVAWACFQLGMLWGEQAPVPQPQRAAQWYALAIAYLPGYVKARVHLAEIRLRDGQFQAAESLLRPALAASDPEVRWRLAEVMAATGSPTQAQMQLQAARAGFDGLLESHLLAFADHGAAFYLGSGNDPARAFELARINLANRPTMRAYQLAYSTAIGAGAPQAAADLLATARGRWGSDLKFH
ncbi:hypothetical protein QTI66_04670, partial [Variovorax sp. J22R133]|uniref:hypothetical protein n=1 Tax=Variovorax brevis TaxID=3053503 RepID=UPI0025784FFC